MQVATNWNETSRAQTSPENDYANNEANVPIEISDFNVHVLTDAQAWQHVERAVLVAPQLTGLATWRGSLSRLLAALAHSGHAAEAKREALPKSLELCVGQHLGPAAVQAVTLRFQVQSKCRGASD